MNNFIIIRTIKLIGISFCELFHYINEGFVVKNLISDFALRVFIIFIIIINKIEY